MTYSTERLTSALSSQYRIERQLGQGGMATVYLANDLKHDRKVAIKVLKPELAAVIGADRFLVEIKTTAQLQHPHILPLFDSGNADSILYYVMPYVEGETLRARLDRETQLPIDDAIRLTREVADALDYAHRHGVIHRDIKPENILLHDGRPVVADFGIALALSAAAGGRMTETGMSLGTPHYMSPEQATADKEITGRSDIYSLGSVLYEMLAGEPPHLGNSAQQIIMKIIAEEAPSVTKYRKSVPEHVAAAVAKAIEKLPADRFATAKEFADALGDPNSAGALRTGKSLRGSTVSVAAGRRRRWTTGALVGSAALATILAAWGWLRPAPVPQVVRYRMAFAPGQEIREAIAGINVAISPDGKWLAYSGTGPAATHLYLRARDRLDATPIPGSEGATNPYFSPDGTKLAFHVGANFSLTVVPVAGGPAVQLDRGGPGSGGGGAWNSDGYIYFDSPLGTSRIDANGGTAELFIPLDTANGEIGFAWTEALPNGKGLVFRSRRNLDPNDFDIYAIDIKTRTRHLLTKGVIARYVAPGYLLILRGDGTLHAAPFDQEKLSFTGPMVPLLAGVMVKPLGSADLAISRTGTLFYMPGGSSVTGLAEVVTVDRNGRLNSYDPPVTYNPASNRGLSLAPDGRHVAIEQLGAASPDIWVKTLPAGPLTRLTFDSVNAFRPQWSADGRYVYYVGGPIRGLWRVRSDGSSSPERVWSDSRGDIMAYSISRDGAWLVYRISLFGTNRDLYAVRLGQDTTPIPLLTAPYFEDAPALSPDGRWLAYTSAESSRDEVFVRPFPNVNDGRWQISSSGGQAPRWSRDGRELYFEDPNVNLYAVPVRTTPTFSNGTPRKVVDASVGLSGSVTVPYYDILPDGRGIIAGRLGSGRAGATGTLPIVTENWTTELLARMQAH